MNPKISKSQYMYGLQCELRLWYYRNKKELKPEVDAVTQAMFDQGNFVGEIAKSYFKNGAEVKAQHYEFEKANEQTIELMNQGYDAVFEAFAVSEDGLYSRIDILKRVKKGVNEWDLIEVKSSTRAKPHFIEDMAAQRYAFEGAGFNIRKSYLMVIDNQYVRERSLDPKGLFTFIDCTETVLDLMPSIDINLEAFKRVLNKKSEPNIEAGDQCMMPYECPYLSYCCPEEGEVLEFRGKPKVKKDILNEFLNQLQYPLYFLDYETINLAVPPFEGMSPYKQYPFQYSLHIQEVPGGGLTHKEYLHQEPSDPRPALIKNLINDCGSRGSVIVYSQSFEAARNREMAEEFPEFSSQLLSINDRMLDLAVPFRKKGLHYPEFGSKYSIKITLPAFVPELSYKNLDIQGGSEASMLYAGLLMGHVNDVDAHKLANDLKEYCKLDTLAMVKLLEVLSKYV